MAQVDEFTDDDDATGGDAHWRVGNAIGEDAGLDEELAGHSVEGSAADAASGAMGVRLDVQDVLRRAKRTHVKWHTILNHHAASRRSEVHGGKLCHSVNACKDFCRFGSMHMCRLVLPNSYAPGDGIVTSEEAVALTRSEASEDVCMAVFVVLLCADRDGRPNVLFRPAHWNVPIEVLLHDLRRIVDPWATYQPLAVSQRAAASSVADLIPGANLERAAEFIRACLRAHGGSFDPCQIWGVYAIQLADVLPEGNLWDFIEQHPEFDIYEEERRWYIKWRSATQDGATTEASAPATFALVDAASALSAVLSRGQQQQNDSSLTAAASGAPSASASGEPSFVRDFEEELWQPKAIGSFKVHYLRSAAHDDNDDDDDDDNTTAEKIRKEKEEDDARYFHMLREQASGRLKLFMPTADYRWFQYCFQGYELPNGQSVQQILNMAAVHDEINNFGIYEYDPDGEDDSCDEDYDGVPRRVAQWFRGRPIYNQYATSASAASASAASGAPSFVRDFSDGDDREDLSGFWRIGPGRFWRRPS